MFTRASFLPSLSNLHAFQVTNVREESLYNDPRSPFTSRRTLACSCRTFAGSCRTLAQSCTTLVSSVQTRGISSWTRGKSCWRSRVTTSVIYLQLSAVALADSHRFASDPRILSALEAAPRSSEAAAEAEVEAIANPQQRLPTIKKLTLPP
jgi:hypothetical protein